MSRGLELTAAKGRDSRVAPQGPLQGLASPPRSAEGCFGLAKVRKRSGQSTRAQSCLPLSMTRVAFRAQEKQKEPRLSAWFSTATFGETFLWLESPTLTHRLSNIKASRTASTVLNSYFNGTGFRRVAGAMTGVPARQRPAAAPSSHLETSASNLGIKCSWFSVKLSLLPFRTQRDMP